MMVREWVDEMGTQMMRGRDLEGDEGEGFV